MPTDAISVADHVGASIAVSAGRTEEFEAPHFTYELQCVGPDGALKWSETIHNLVTDAGRNDLLNKYFKGSAYTAAWYLGLKGAGTVAAADTLASHAGWAEVTPYTGNRPAITFGTTASASNTATAVAYSITAVGPTTVAGIFIASVNSGTSGTLYSGGDFAVSRAVSSGDTVTATPTVTA